MRFGCWMCTVVMKDRTMMALAKAGDVKVQKLLKLREWIVEESKKPENRYFRKDGRKGRLRLELRKELLSKLVSLQKEINIVLITKPEIRRIEQLFDSAMYLDYSNSSV